MAALKNTVGAIPAFLRTGGAMMRRSVASAAPSDALPAFRVALVNGHSALGPEFVAGLGDGLAFGKDQMLELSIFGGKEDVKGSVVKSQTTAKSLEACVDKTEYVVAVQGKGDLQSEAKFFADLGKAVSATSYMASVFVVGPNSNTLAMVLAHNAKGLDRESVMSVTLADQVIAQRAIAKRASVNPEEVERVVVWGGSGPLAFADAAHAVAKGGWLGGNKWVEEIPEEVRKSKADVSVWGKAVLDTIRHFHVGDAKKPWVSLGIQSRSMYGINENLWFSLPTINGVGLSYQRVHGIPIDPFAAKKMQEVEAALIKERDAVKSFL
eukprot:CAMPEP_0184692392 /NCGR_PEP_ID=MMETSP0313-20130426/894_1 /TAXON_ID=2792 /ORGANISM="Porphyridium aerugineum, Strain SAG 1380-2" /LENGTH=323 /DNA_ID=CAMNT_0027150219 /DNA_START=152 /DNA_END=1123 /DNA_ORIENTATION=-